MKRAFPQKVKPVSCHTSTVDALVGQSKQISTGTNRKARTSAAMIGLALSMGASSLLLPRQNDGAAAAEPIAAESTVTVVPLAHQVAILPSPAEAESTVDTPASTARSGEHVVQDGQTLWQLARLYRVSVGAIATANHISIDAPLYPGQVLMIPSPAEAQVANASAIASVAAPLEKTERDESLTRLRMESDKLRNRLTGWRSGTTAHPSAESFPKSPVSVSEQPSPSTLRETSSNEAVLPSVPIQNQTAALPVEGNEGESVHQVRSGETLGAIAHTYNISQQQLMAVNHLSDPDWLRVNQSLVLPQPSATTPVEPQGSSAAPAATAEPEGIPTSPLQPVVTQPEVSLPASGMVYQVKPGDTIGQIAAAYNVPSSVLVQTNQLTDPNIILAGQRLRIPGSDTHSSAIVSTTETVSTPVVLTTNVSLTPEPPLSEATLPTSTQIVASPMVPAMPNESVEPQATVPSSEANTPIVVAQAEPAAIATAPFGTHTTETRQPNPYVANLLAEVMSLRDRYRSGEMIPPHAGNHSTVVATTSEALLPSPEPLTDSRINPEFSPTRYLDSQAAQSPGMQRQVEQQQPMAAVVTPSPSPDVQPPVVAVAPLGSENYEPLLQPMTGQMVSPDLPPLPGPDNFLPDGSTRFNGYIWPARGVLTSGYGWRWGRMHRGIDIGAPIGTPVHAAAAGVVEYSGWNSGGYGNMVEIRHADGSLTRYGHHSRNLVRVGQRVDQGQQIAEVGSTGYSTGPHLHFEVHLPNQGTVNPIAYLPR